MANFSSPENGPYVETYLSINSKSVKYVLNEHKKYAASIEVDFQFYIADSLVSGKKYNLLSQETDDSISLKNNFIDLQRFLLTPGSYTLKLRLKDNNSNSPAVEYSKLFEVHSFDSSISISDIQLVENYSVTATSNALSKNGYDLVPYVSSFFPANQNSLTFYCEIYNTQRFLGENEKLILKYSIESYETRSVMSNYSVLKKLTSARMLPLMATIPIKDLPSGNYNLLIEIISKNNDILATQKRFFQRHNPIVQLSFNDLGSISTDSSFIVSVTDPKTLSEYIRCLRPISSESEKTFADNQLKGLDTKLMQQYFLNFWQIRNPENPEKYWKKYKKDVDTVQYLFGSKTTRGYDTHMGRVYLQYGAPDIRTQVPSEPDAYPYEIWQYYKLKDQADRKFIFYDPELGTGKFMLIHSDARGEIFNPRWKYKIYSRTYQTYDVDAETLPDKMGNNADDMFINPY